MTAKVTDQILFLMMIAAMIAMGIAPSLWAAL